MSQSDFNGPPQDVSAIRRELEACLNTADSAGILVGNYTYGVYAFYDYDGEPIYVGQTKEKLRTRIRRHLTNQRTDAVAMNVLDPFEVAEVEMWPLVDLESLPAGDPRILATLNSAEYTVFTKVLTESSYSAVLNEKDISPTGTIALPPSYRRRIVPDHLFEERRHPDVRIARRAATIASLAKVISERQVSTGLRRTLVTQARRLEHLARQRMEELGNTYPVEALGEETGDGPNTDNQ